MDHFLTSLAHGIWRSASKDISRNLSCLRYLKKIYDKILQKKLSNPKTEVIFEIFEKKKPDFMCYTWYGSIHHWHHWFCDWWQKNNMCLVQHRRYKKSHSAVPKTECWAMICCVSPSHHVLLLIRLVNLFTFVLKKQNI